METLCILIMEKMFFFVVQRGMSPLVHPNIFRNTE